MRSVSFFNTLPRCLQTVMDDAVEMMLSGPEYLHDLRPTRNTGTCFRCGLKMRASAKFCACGAVQVCNARQWYSSSDRCNGAYVRESWTCVECGVWRRDLVSCFSSVMNARENTPSFHLAASLVIVTILFLILLACAPRTDPVAVSVLSWCFGTAWAAVIGYEMFAYFYNTARVGPLPVAMDTFLSKERERFERVEAYVEGLVDLLKHAEDVDVKTE